MKTKKWILLVEDNANDADLVMRALRANQSATSITLATDGLAAMDCLHRRGSFESLDDGPPAVVLLDLKMPRVGGLEVLRQIKEDGRLKCIPVVVFTSSREEQDVERSYQLGANAYVVKPVEFRQYVAAVQGLHSFWMSVNEPPPTEPRTEPRRDNAAPSLVASAAAA